MLDKRKGIFTFLCQVSQRCAENLMTSRHMAMVFSPCLLILSDMSVQPIEICIDVFHTFIDNRWIFGVLPKVVMRSMPLLFGSWRVQDALSKKKHKKRFSLQVVPMSEPTSSSRSQESFPNVLLFRMYTPHLGQQKCADAHRKGACRTLLGHFARFA